MKLLKIEDGCGHYWNKSGQFDPIDRVTKEDLLELVNWTLGEEQVDIDPYDEDNIKNQAHQIIYRSIAQKLSGLLERKQEFVDQSKRLYLDDYEKYRNATAPD
jgi:hypothetical protein